MLLLKQHNLVFQLTFRLAGRYAAAQPLEEETWIA